jgi:hypothetical protein
LPTELCEGSERFRAVEDAPALLIEEIASPQIGFALTITPLRYARTICYQPHIHVNSMDV